MRKVTINSKHVRTIFSVLLFFIAVNSLKAQPTVFVTSKDYDGNGVIDQLWFGTNSYVYIKHGGTGVWTYYYMGPSYSFTNSGVDLDGTAGAEIALWHPSSESIVVITDRTKTTKGYYLGSTGINKWVQCTNSFTNLNGQAGNEIMIDYYTRASTTKKGLMIIHRTKSTRSTWSCFNLASRQAGTGSEENLDVPNTSPETTGFTFDESTATPEEIVRFKTTPYFDHVSDKDNITLSPNPTTGIVNIQTDKADELIKQVVITDAQGKAVFTSRTGNKRIDISHLANGLYFYQVQGSKKTVTGKLIKQ